MIKIKQLFALMDNDRSNYLDWEEFVQGILFNIDIDDAH